MVEVAGPSIHVTDPARKRDLLDRPEHAHIVQFYEADGELVEAVSQYMLAGLAAGEPLVIVATPEHREAFTRKLAAKGFDAAVLVESGRLSLFDARETLAKFMRGDTPDPVLFEEVVGGRLDRIREQQSSSTIRAYGEMVDLLWRDGSSNAALQLEALWNDLGRRRAFSLFCAYVIGNFYHVDGHAGIEAVCAAHSHVLVGEQDPEALRERARVLSREVTERRKLEAALRESLDQRAAAQSQLEALQRIVKAVHSELDLEQVVQRVTDEATAICHAEFGAFFYNVIDPAGERYGIRCGARVTAGVGMVDRAPPAGIASSRRPGASARRSSS